jgi:SPX domain protein involved in polyphosphate accumulation
MRFGRTLRNAIYEPWKDHYIDYTKLKSLLREHETGETDKHSWTDQDEGRFVEELVNVQLEKVHTFHAEKYRELGERTARCETKLEGVSGHKGAEERTGEDSGATSENKVPILTEVEEELDSISKEINELEKFSRINYTGFLKAAKKHDRRRGANYRVRPLLQVRLASLPFNSEDYSPLLYRYDRELFKLDNIAKNVIDFQRCTHMCDKT